MFAQDNYDIRLSEEIMNYEVLDPVSIRYNYILESEYHTTTSDSNRLNMFNDNTLRYL